MKIVLQPQCLQWARERARLSVSELANKLKIKEEKITAWEQSGELTLSLAERLANATHIPLGYLFLPEPLDEELPIKDFRTVEGEEISNPSVDLIDVVNEALQRQDWYRDYILTNSGEAITFVGSLKTSDNILKAAEQIRTVVAWNSNLSTQSSSWEVALSRHIDAVEEAGILVMRSGIVGNNTQRPLSVSEFRGFALSDNYAPLIFINAKDAKAAQLFTLAHEMVHIWLGISGVSNLRQTFSSNTDVEKFCNAVAAELLVPSGELKTFLSTMDDSIEKIAFAARHFKVSSLVILRRLRDLRILSEDEFQERYTDELSQFGQNQTVSASTGGGDFYLTLRARLGKRFSAAIVESTLEGATAYRDAFQLLGINKPEIIREFATKIGIMG